ISPVVEAADSAAGLAYLDAHGLERLWGDPAAVARKALQALATRDLAARAGAGPARLVALALARRMGAEGPRALAEPEARAFLHALPINDPTLGLLPTTATALRELGITTAGALAALPLAGVALRFGPDAIAAHHSVAGAADPPLHPWRPPDSLAVEHRVEAGVLDATIVQALLRRLSDRLAAQLVERGQAVATLMLHVTCEDGARLAQRAHYGIPLRPPRPWRRRRWTCSPAVTRCFAAARPLPPRSRPWRCRRRTCAGPTRASAGCGTTRRWTGGTSGWLQPWPRTRSVTGKAACGGCAVTRSPPTAGLGRR